MENINDIDPNILSNLIGKPVSIEQGGEGNNGSSTNAEVEHGDNATGQESKKQISIPTEVLSAFRIKEDELTVNDDEDAYAKLAEIAQNKYKESLPPLTRFVLEHSNDPTFDEKEFAKKIIGQANELTPEQKLNEYLYEKYGGKYDEKENPSGLTEQDVKEYLDGKTKIEIKELMRAAEDNFSKKKGEALSEYEKYLVAENEKYLNSIIEEQERNAKRILESTKNINSIYGITLSKEEQQEFNNVFPTLITPSKETGIAPLLEMIYSMNDEQLYKLAYTLYAKENLLSEKIAEKINSSKKKIIEKVEGSTTRKTYVSDSGSGGVNVQKLITPERK
jgi:hypothetical protein